MSKTIVAFFSRADENYFGGSLRYIEIGNTEVVVGKIKEMIDTDVLKIEMKTPYAKDYMTCINEAKADLQGNRRPELVTLPDIMEDYETIILAYPNYWGTIPMAVMTFLEAYDFSGKKILPLCTHEGSGMGHSEADIRKLCHGATVKKGLAILGSKAADSESVVEKWLRENALL